MYAFGISFLFTVAKNDLILKTFRSDAPVTHQNERTGVMLDGLKKTLMIRK